MVARQDLHSKPILDHYIVQVPFYLGTKNVTQIWFTSFGGARHESTSPIQKDQADSSRCMKALVILRAQDQKNLKIKEKDSGKPAVPRVSPFLFAPVLDLSKLDHMTY